MTKEQFNNFWYSTYPDTKPISYFFKHDYEDRWFRIHSLPESKRYPGNEVEWKILLDRQNQLITDLFGNNSTILLVTGEYNWNSPTDIHITEEDNIFKSFSFTRLDNIDLYSISPDEYDKGQVYRPAFAETIWNQNKHDELLREIAVDNIRAFFISIDKNILIAPYDGGIDIILKDLKTRDSYKQKYKNWLSLREDGY